MTATRLVLGAPGVYRESPEPLFELTGVRRDITAFVGVAPRGPVRVPKDPVEPDTDLVSYLSAPPSTLSRSLPVAVTSWDEYRLHFGGFEGSGLLPYAVSAFLAQGGSQAYVVRIVHDYGADPIAAAGCASGRFASLTTRSMTPVTLLARSEGHWGDRLRVTLSFATRPLALIDSNVSELRVPTETWLPVGSLLRVTLPGGDRRLLFVDDSQVVPRPDGKGTQRVVRLEAPLPAPAQQVEDVRGRVDVVDDDPLFPRSERFDGLGLHADHPQWMARVLAAESLLLWPDATWAGEELRLLDDALPSFHAALEGGLDRSNEIVPDDFFDARWVPGDDAAGSGIYCLAELDDVGLLVAPDLYSPAPLAPFETIADSPTVAGPTFADCVPVNAPAPREPLPAGLDGLRLDPILDIDVIARLQQRLIDFVELRGDVVALVDVPPGLSQAGILGWRDRFDSAYAAAYHPWLDVAPPDDSRDALIRVTPSAFAAGIIAAKERKSGIAFGPANELARTAVRAALVVPPPRHDELHLASVNVFLPERDGIRLTAARTLCRSARLRQLSVVRLMSMLRLTLEQRMQWVVFEPNNERLWADVRRVVDSMLRRLYAAGAFRGATAAEAYFVRCDRTTMFRNDLDGGRLIAEVGVAPAEPLEYLVFRLATDGVSSLTIELAGAH